MKGGNVMNYKYEVTIQIPYTNKVLYRVHDNLEEAIHGYELCKMFADKGEVISLNVYLNGTLIRSFVARF